MHERFCEIANVVSHLCALCGKHIGTSLLLDGESGQLGGVLGFLSVTKKAVSTISQGISKEAKVKRGVKRQSRSTTKTVSRMRVDQDNTEAPPGIATPNRIRNAPQKLEHTLHLPDRQNFVLDLLSSRCVLRRRQSEMETMTVVVVVVIVFFVFHGFELLWTARREDRQ